ncbi:hypothetical protein CBP27_09630, partial [Fischerella thermalis WC542]
TKDNSSEVNTPLTLPVQKTDSLPVNPEHTNGNHAGVAQSGDEVMNRKDAKYAKKGFFDRQIKENHPANMHSQAEQSTSLEAPQNYQLVLDSLEFTLIEFNRHQRDILRVHEKSLLHQTEYTKIFFQLMQQQNLLLGNSKFPHQHADTKQIIISYSERSIMRFHQHHGETLRVHEQYLNHQTEQTKNFFQLLQQHYDQLLASISTEELTESLPQTTSIVSYQDS